MKEGKSCRKRNSEKGLGGSEIVAVTRSFKELRMESMSGKTVVWNAAAAKKSLCIVAVHKSLNNVYFGAIESVLTCTYKNNMVAKFAVVKAYTSSHKAQKKTVTSGMLLTEELTKR